MTWNVNNSYCDRDKQHSQRTGSQGAFVYSTVRVIDDRREGTHFRCRGVLYWFLDWRKRKINRPGQNRDRQLICLATASHDRVRWKLFERSPGAYISATLSA